ncbi:MAG: hypothetical protein ACYC0Q_12845 [Eubacteriales bacterium]
MNPQVKSYSNDYRINTLSNGSIISVEITCCGSHIGEMRFKDGESRRCPACGTEHFLKIQHNHFHIRPVKREIGQVDNLYSKVAAAEG